MENKALQIQDGVVMDNLNHWFFGSPKIYDEAGNEMNLGMSLNFKTGEFEYVEHEKDENGRPTKIIKSEDGNSIIKKIKLKNFSLKFSVE